MEAKDLLKKVRKVEIKTKRLSNNLFGGEYQSAFKGRGMTNWTSGIDLSFPSSLLSSPLTKFENEIKIKKMLNVNLNIFSV